MKRIAGGLLFALIILYNGCALAQARSSILIESTTGRVLEEHNAHEAVPMASTTKVMTALLALENGRLSDRVTASRNAFGVPGTSIYLSEGETLSLEEMLYGLMLASGNDAAVAIAEHIGGSVQEFCAMMTARAQELGCESTVFLTPHGLPKAGHYTTARDLALIAREAMKNEVFRTIVSTKSAKIPWEGHDYDRVLNNKNRLLTTYAGANGIKTGYTAAAGRCLVFSAERDGLELIGVVLNCPDWFDEATALLDRGFEKWQMVTIVEKDEPVRTVPVEGGVYDSVVVCAQADVKTPVRYEDWPEITISLPQTLQAPVQKGQQVGTIALSDDGTQWTEIPLYASGAVPVTTFRTDLGRLFDRWLLLSR